MRTLIHLFADASNRLYIEFRAPEDEAPDATAIMARLGTDWDAEFDDFKDDILGDEVWCNVSILDRRFEFGSSYGLGVYLMALEPESDETLLRIAARFAREIGGVKKTRD